MKYISYFQLISLSCLGLYLLGVLSVYFSDKNEYCLMTYMFEYPQFVRITVADNKKYPQYGLYSYSEGRLTEKARKMRFNGIPVLYIPGNSGSHKQVRSLASVALRKSISDVRGYHFDYFTMDTNEDLSGVYGAMLEDLTEFAEISIHRILELYKINSHMQTIPKYVILIGHSMGGVIAKRLLFNPSTANVTKLAITLAAPLQAPVINFDQEINKFYKKIDKQWSENTKNFNEKVLISFGSGVRDVLVPPSLIGSAESDFNGLTTSIPGVWVSTNHVSVVWCKQVVMKLNKFLFAIIESSTSQLMEDKTRILAKANSFFKANRSMIVNPTIPKNTVNMLQEGFWYEDNRRIYQVSRPEIDKMTYLMVRLIDFPQNRFAAIQAINVDDSEWIFGCNANEVSSYHRFCKSATSLSELSQWTAVAEDNNKRKLATIHLHDLKLKYPNWSHVIVKISPTRKPVTLNIDINDHASRSITADLPSQLSFGKTVIMTETERDAIFYEILLPGFELVHQAYFLYVEPLNSCASDYHVSAEFHVPWAENFEYYHFFTKTKKSPMKLRLFKNSPNISLGLPGSEPVKVTLLLDPKCTYSISISQSRYHQLAQFTRNYTSVIVPYMAAILLLIARVNFARMSKDGGCMSLQSAMCGDMWNFYALICTRIGVYAVYTTPLLTYIFDTASIKNLELQYFTNSANFISAYLVAYGLVAVMSAAYLAAMVFSSQLAHRLLLRVVFRSGGGAVGEKLAGALQRAPLLVSGALLCAAPASCGAAPLAAGAAFYMFMLSKMYEEYLEDYAYKFLAKLMSKLKNIFVSKKTNSELVPLDNNYKDNLSENEIHKAVENKIENTSQNIGDSSRNISLVKIGDNIESNDESTEINSKTIEKNKVDNDGTTEINADLKTTAIKQETAISKEETIKNDDKSVVSYNTTTDIIVSKQNNDILNMTETQDTNQPNEEKKHIDDISDTGRKDTHSRRVEKRQEDIDEQLNSIHFHSMMFFLWLIVAKVNVPVLITWARNYKYSRILKTDTSFIFGIIMTVCVGFIWNMDGPRRNLKHYPEMSNILFVLAVLVMIFGPLGFYFINYLVTIAFVLITLQQLFDKETNLKNTPNQTHDDNLESDREKTNNDHEDAKKTTGDHGDQGKTRSDHDRKTTSDQENVRGSNLDGNDGQEIYEEFKNMKDKTEFMDTDMF